MTQRTLIPSDILRQLAEDPELGSGNFLHYAERLNPNRDIALVFFDEPLRLFGRDHTELSTSALKTMVDGLAGWYHQAGVRPRDPIAIFVDNNFKNSIHFMALTGLGAIPVLVNANITPEIAALFIEKVGAVGLVCDRSHHEPITEHLSGGDKLRLRVLDDDITLAPNARPARYPYPHHDDDPVLICHSSGTTGIPKAVTNHHQQYFFGPRYRMRAPLRPGAQRALSAFPHSHSAGVSFPMRAIITGTPIMIVSGQDPENILHSIDRFEATTVGAFSEIYAKLAKQDLDQHGLRSVRTWLNTGDSAHEAHIRPLVAKGSHFEGDRLVPGSTFVDGLGSSEMGYSMFKKEHTATSDSYERCVGTPFEFVEAVILGEDGEPLGPNRVGMIGFKAPSITPGYWNDSPTTYRAQKNGYWMPGDVGYRNDRGEYFHLDRAVDVIHGEDGPTYTLPTEERIQNEYAELADCSVFGVEDGDGHDRPIAFAWAVPGQPRPSAAKMLQDLNRKYSNGRRFIDAVAVVDLDQIPLGATGKVLKRRLRAEYEAFLLDPSVRAELAGDVAIAT